MQAGRGRPRAGARPGRRRRGSPARCPTIPRGPRPSARPIRDRKRRGRRGRASAPSRAGRFLRLERLLEEIGKRRSERRVRGGVVAAPLIRLLAAGHGGGGDVQLGRLDRQDRGRLRQGLLREVPERGIIVEDVDAAAERADDQVVSRRWISRSRTAMGGIPPLSGCQCWPPSRVAKSPKLGPHEEDSAVPWSTAIV